MKSSVSFSQNQEDIIIASFFPDDKKGVYVDVGAHHPVFDSVTKYFYSRGWNGINIEPIEKYHKLLVADRKNDINLQIGIGLKEEILTLREYTSEAGEGMSTFSDEMKGTYTQQNHWATTDFIEHEVKVVPLKKVFERNLADEDIDFLKVDVEGFEFEVLKSNDWEKYRPYIVCVEANHIIKDWHMILEKADYQKVYDDGLNHYFADKKRYDNSFSYSESILLRYPRIIQWDDYKVLRYALNSSEKLNKLFRLQSSQHNKTKKGSETARTSLKKFINDLRFHINGLYHKRSRIPKVNGHPLSGFSESVFLKINKDNKISNAKLALAFLLIKTLNIIHLFRKFNRGVNSRVVR